MAVNYKNLIRLSEEKGRDGIAEAFESKAVRTGDIDLGRLFVECFGWNNFVACRNRESLANDVMSQALLEDEGAVSTNAFQNVSGQFVFQNTMDAYNAEDNIFTKLIPEAPASTLDGEKIPGITEIGDEIAVRKEGDPYALAGVGENWLFSPSIKDRGLIIALTWEALFNDKVGQLPQRCGDVGKWGGVNREKAAIDCFIDEIVNDTSGSWRYNWRGNVIASYNDNTGTHSWDNLSASNGLVDWNNLNTAEINAAAIVDPFTQEPITIEPRHLVVTKQLEQTANRLINATEIRVATPGFATSGNPTQTTMANPYKGKYEVVCSRQLTARMATKTSWFLADIAKYAKCMMAEKANVLQAPPNNQDEFHRRIVSQWRFNERRAYVVVEPRVSNKSTVA
jgi:hypothetical protein